MKREKDKTKFLTAMAMTILHISKEVLSAYSRSYNQNKTTSAITISSLQNLITV